MYQCTRSWEEQTTLTRAHWTCIYLILSHWTCIYMILRAYQCWPAIILHSVFSNPISFLPCDGSGSNSSCSISRSRDITNNGRSTSVSSFQFFPVSNPIASTTMYLAIANHPMADCYVRVNHRSKEYLNKAPAPSLYQYSCGKMLWLLSAEMHWQILHSSYIPARKLMLDYFHLFYNLLCRLLAHL